MFLLLFLSLVLPSIGILVPVECFIVGFSYRYNHTIPLTTLYSLFNGMATGMAIVSPKKRRLPLCDMIFRIYLNKRKFKRFLKIFYKPFAHYDRKYSKYPDLWLKKRVFNSWHGRNNEKEKHIKRSVEEEFVACRVRLKLFECLNNLNSFLFFI